MYSISDYSVNYFLRNASHIYACTYPNPQFMVLAEMSTFGIFRGRNVRGRTFLQLGVRPNLLNVLN